MTTSDRISTNASRTALEQRRAALQENIQTAQRELEMVEFALRVLDGGLFQERPKVPPLQFTPNGTIKNLPDAVVLLLDTYGKAMTISDMADVWFTFSMKMTLDQLRRRLSVTTSAMFKKPKPGHSIPIVPAPIKKSKNREIYWSRPAWIVNGILMNEHMPENMDTT